MLERTSPALPWSTHGAHEHLLDSAEADGGLLRSDHWRMECHWVLTDYSQQAQCHEPHHVTQHIWCRILIRNDQRLSGVHGRLFFIPGESRLVYVLMDDLVYIDRVKSVWKISHNFHGWFRWFSSYVFGVLDNKKILSLACKWEIMYSGRNNEASLSHHNCKQIEKPWKLCSFINIDPNYC